MSCLTQTNWSLYKSVFQQRQYPAGVSSKPNPTQRSPAVPSSLASSHLGQGHQDLTANLEEIYAAASQRAAGIYLNQAEPQPHGTKGSPGKAASLTLDEAPRQEF